MIPPRNSVLYLSVVVVHDIGLFEEMMELFVDEAGVLRTLKVTVQGISLDSPGANRETVPPT